MSHELDTFADGRARMTYVGEKPWHKLGQKAVGNESLDEFMKLAGCDFTVRMDPIFAGADSANSVQVPGFRALTREDTAEVLDVVSDRYKPISNQVFFSTAREFLKDQSVSLDTSGVLRQGRHVWLLCKLNESFTVAGGKDQTDAYLLLSNHYLAGFASSIMLTPVRVVCNNTITMALNGEGRRWTHSHLAEFDAEAAKTQLGIGKMGFRKYGEQAEFLTAKRMKAEDFVTYIKRVYALNEPKSSDDVETRERNQRVIDRLKEILPSQAGAQYAAGSWWQGYNAVTHDNDHIIGRSESVRLASAWYGVGAQRKHKALQVALEYANAA